MKQVPYKCRFGHVTIKNYYSNTKGTIYCEECMKLAGREIYIDSHSMKNKDSYNRSIVRYEEMAVRI